MPIENNNVFYLIKPDMIFFYLQKTQVPHLCVVHTQWKVFWGMQWVSGFYSHYSQIGQVNTVNSK